VVLPAEIPLLLDLAVTAVISEIGRDVRPARPMGGGTSAGRFGEATPPTWNHAAEAAISDNFPNFSYPQRNIRSVVAQPMQESVMETP